MILTAAQRATLKTNIDANTTSITVTYDTGTQITNQIKNLPNDGTTANAIATWYNGLAAVDFFANHSKVLLQDVKNAILASRYTPTDLPPTAAVPNTPTAAETYALSLHTARTLHAQCFQLSLNNLFSGSSDGLLDCTKANVVKWLSDATNTNMATGASGASQKGGWAGATGVITVICRKCSNAEKLFADTSQANGSTNQLAATLVYDAARDGALNGTEILAARNGQ